MCGTFYSAYYRRMHEASSDVLANNFISYTEFLYRHELILFLTVKKTNLFANRPPIWSDVNGYQVFSALRE